MMTSRPFANKSSSLTRPRRPPLGSRNSSGGSSITSSIRSLDSQPTTPTRPSASSGSYFSANDISRAPASLLHPPSPLRETANNNFRIGRSQPIAIDQPARRKSSTTGFETPPEPLSARGDLLGGYFPLHEDVSRSHKPHPFDNPAPTAAMADTDTPIYTPHGHLAPQPQSSNPVPPMAPPPLPFFSPVSFSTGKYHPSNYKNKTPTAGTPTAERPVDDIKTKLQQYQRDMVEAAVRAGATRSTAAKPKSPRLLPLGSPGPVTPMELEERERGWLEAGTTSAGR